MTFEEWWTSDENRWSDTRYTKKVAEMAWNAGRTSLHRMIIDELQKRYPNELRTTDAIQEIKP